MRNVILSITFVSLSFFGFAQTNVDSCYNGSTNIDCSCHIYVPNAFTPNADEFNSQFGAKIDCPLDTYQFTILNRWGQTIFESYDPSVNWDGTVFNVYQPSGLYLYSIRYRFVGDSETKVVAGHMMLL